MGNILSNFALYWGDRRLFGRKSAFNTNIHNPLSDYQYNQGKPSWVSLSTPGAQEKAARFNPIVKNAINLRANTASNGRKVAIDVNSGKEIPWNEGNEGVKKAFELLVQRPNVMQSSKEFQYQGIFFLDVFGNRYVYANMPIGFDKEIDLLNVSTLSNLNSQFVDVHLTGKYYDQTTLDGIIKEYAATNENPIRLFSPNEIIHFNEVNISKDYAGIMGISKLEVLEKPISNVDLGFAAMNNILKSHGMAGIISPSKKDGMGANVPLLPDEKKQLDEKFKTEYGIQPEQNMFWISPIQMDYIKTAMSAEEMGVYKDLASNSIVIGNEYGIPPELAKIWIEGSTYENQGQSVKRLYQDTTIPLVEEQDNQWSWRLNTRKYGFILQTKWDHIPALAESFKEKSVARKMDSATAEAGYESNNIKRNQYLELIGLPPVDKNGDLYKYEWDKIITGNNNGGSGDE